MPEDNLNNEIMAIQEQEWEVEEALSTLQEQYPDAFAQMKQIEEAQKKVQALKDAVKAKLIEDKDFDLHEVGDLKVSLSAVAKVKVVDMDKVPDDFKEVKTVLKEKKAQEYLKVMGKAPEGLEDNSYYRLNWKYSKKEEQ